MGRWSPMNEDFGLMELVERAQTGDEAAMEKLLSELRPIVRRYARLAGNNDTEDLEQELYIALLELIRRYRPPHPR